PKRWRTCSLRTWRASRTRAGSTLSSTRSTRRKPSSADCILSPGMRARAEQGHLPEGHHARGHGARAGEVRMNRRTFAFAVLTAWAAVLGIHVRREYFAPASERLAEAARSLAP